MGTKKQLVFVVSVCLVLVFSASSLFAQKKPIELNWVSFIPRHMYIYKVVQEYFIDKVNEQAKGELNIKFRGGPETFGPFDIPKAVQSGIVDIGTTFVGAIEPIVPGVQGDMFTRLTLDEERRPGGPYDFLLSLYKKGGLYYFGRGLHEKEGFFYTVLRDKKVERLEDLRGLTMGGTTAAQAPAMAWGCTYILINSAEAYSALERGVVDAQQSIPASSLKSRSTYEVTKYIIYPPIYCSTVRVFMNLKSFNNLPGHLQDLMVKTFIKAEKAMARRGEEVEVSAFRWMVDNGHLEVIKFSPEDTKQYVDAAIKGGWEYQQKRFPEITPKLRALYSK